MQNYPISTGLPDGYFSDVSRRRNYFLAWIFGTLLVACVHAIVDSKLDLGYFVGHFLPIFYFWFIVSYVISHFLKRFWPTKPFLTLIESGTTKDEDIFYHLRTAFLLVQYRYSWNDVDQRALEAHIISGLRVLKGRNATALARRETIRSKSNVKLTHAIEIQSLLHDQLLPYVKSKKDLNNVTNILRSLQIDWFRAMTQKDYNGLSFSDMLPRPKSEDATRKVIDIQKGIPILETIKTILFQPRIIPIIIGAASIIFSIVLIVSINIVMRFEWTNSDVYNKIITTSGFVFLVGWTCVSLLLNPQSNKKNEL